MMNSNPQEPPIVEETTADDAATDEIVAGGIGGAGRPLQFSSHPRYRRLYHNSNPQDMLASKSPSSTIVEITRPINTTTDNITMALLQKRAIEQAFAIAHDNPSYSNQLASTNVCSNCYRFRDNCGYYYKSYDRETNDRSDKLISLYTHHKHMICHDFGQNMEIDLSKQSREID